MVRRDAHGVPHIEAATQEDLFVAQGYVTAQDRLWQMDVFRRNANGELAEMMGRSLVRHDTAQRVFQFRNTAQRIYTQPRRSRPRTAGCLCARRESLHRAASRFASSGVRAACTIGPSHGAERIRSVSACHDGANARRPLGCRSWRASGSPPELHNPKLEADLYPVGSWRDHPPTGQVVDLSQPHPIPPEPR